MRELQNRLKCKKALATAAAAGIGCARVLRMIEEGAQVIATDIDEGGLGTLAPLSGADVRRLDVTDTLAIQRLAAEVRTIGVLVNCAGIVLSGDVLACTKEDWERSIAINVTSCFEMIQSFLPGMLDRGRGSIINIASVVSSLKATPNRFCYGTTKAAAIGITNSVAVGFVSRGIRCNAICPGTVDTPSLQQRLQATGNYEKAGREFEARQPMGRLARVEEMSSLVAFLASEEAGLSQGRLTPSTAGGLYEA